ncbi:MAG: transporter substrate-binding domain-containing protein [Limnobacter sp.]|nr:transporter substrate-binding domain-containing protein [Limnobacter sp.]
MKRALFGISGVSALVCALLIGACTNYPHDPLNTLVTVEQTHTLRVGLIAEPPWVYSNVHAEKTEPAGLEPAIVSEFAHALGVTVKWEFLSEAQATEKLKNHALDLVAGGLTKHSPRIKELGFTRPYLKTGVGDRHQHVLAVTQGENRFLVTLEKFLKTHELFIRNQYDNEVES